MNRDHQLSYCKRCKLRKFDPQKGIVCSLTMKHGDFEDTCSDYINDPNADLKKPNDHELQGKTWKIMGISVLIGVIIAITVTSINSAQKDKAYKERFDKFSKSDYESFAAKIVESINAGEIYMLNSKFDYDFFLDRTIGQMYLSTRERAVVGKMIEKEFKPASLITEYLGLDGDFEFLKLYEQNDIPRLLFRVLGNYGIDYLDFELGIKKGKLVLVDAYSYETGSDFSAYFYDTYSFSNGINVLDKNQNVKDHNKAMMIMDQMNSLMDEERLEESLELWHTLPETSKTKKYAALYRINIALGIDVERFVEATEYYHSLFPVDKRATSKLELTFYTKSGDVEMTQLAIENLEGFTGKDHALDFYLGIANFNAGNYESAMINLEYFEFEEALVTSLLSSIYSENCESIHSACIKLMLDSNWSDEQLVSTIEEYIEDSEKIKLYHSCMEELANRVSELPV